MATIASSDSLRLRYVGLESVPSIMPVMTTAFPREYGEAWTADQCRAMLITAGSRLLLAEHDGRAAGFALSRAILDEEELMLLAVTPQFRRIGTGTAIINKMIKNAQANNIARIFVEVRENNPARHFYQKLGFEQIGYRKNYYKGYGNIRIGAITCGLNI